MIECDTKEEQEIGIHEVKETIEHVIYYDKVKEEILKNISVLIWYYLIPITSLVLGV